MQCRNNTWTQEKLTLGSFTVHFCQLIKSDRCVVMCIHCNYRLINYHTSLTGSKMKHINYEWPVAIYYQLDLIHDTMWYKKNNFKAITFSEIHPYMYRVCIFIAISTSLFSKVDWLALSYILDQDINALNVAILTLACISILSNVDTLQDRIERLN